MKNIIKESSLAKEIAILYTELAEKGSAELKINNYFNLRLQLSPFINSTLLLDYVNYFDNKELYNFYKELFNSELVFYLIILILYSLYYVFI